MAYDRQETRDHVHGSTIGRAAIVRAFADTSLPARSFAMAAEARS